MNWSLAPKDGARPRPTAGRITISLRRETYRRLIQCQRARETLDQLVARLLAAAGPAGPSDPSNRSGQQEQ